MARSIGTSTANWQLTATPISRAELAHALTKQGGSSMLGALNIEEHATTARHIRIAIVAMQTSTDVGTIGAGSYVAVPSPTTTSAQNNYGQAQWKFDTAVPRTPPEPDDNEDENDNTTTTMPTRCSSRRHGRKVTATCDGGNQARRRNGSTSQRPSFRYY